jgi:ABC-type multidrug transport system ATPase subunit
MWGPSVPNDVVKSGYDRPRNPWHNEEENRQNRDSDTDDTDEPSPDSKPPNVDGTWGERDAGHMDEVMAMEDFKELRRNLTSLSKSQSHPDQPGGLGRIISRKSTQRTEGGRQPRTAETQDLETGDADKEEDEFQLHQFMHEGHFEKRQNGESAKKVGVTWKNLTVKGAGSKTAFVRTLPNAIIGTFGPDLYKIISGYIPALKLKKHVETRTLLHDFSGTLRDGEMMLVLGMPGSGCSTFLKTIANDRETYAEVTGDVHYGGISAEEQHKQYKGEVNYNGEDDVHFANISVENTLRFALTNKTKKREKGEIPIIVNALMKMFGISHTAKTLVGDEYVRGVSGGERKRVSIAETLATKSTVVCWDNSTRGLDASTALDYAKSLRVMTDVSNRTTLVTLYQAGEGIYQQMDKVLVIDQGRCVFQGDAKEAKQYFVDLGFHCPERQTTADFLTAVTDPSERRFREGYEDRAPKTPEELEKAFRSSPNYRKILNDIEDYEKDLEESGFVDAKEFKKAVQESKSKHVQKKSSYTVSFPRQVLACTQREFWLTWGDKSTL